MSGEANKVQFGLSDVHYAVSTYASQTKTYTYGTPKAIPGAVNLNLPAKIAKIIKYADNIEYYQNVKNHGFDGDFEVVLVPDDFRVDVLGDTIDATTGDLLVNADALTKEFATGFKINGDPYDRKFWLYRCSAGRPALMGKTLEENIDIPNESMSLTAMPRENDKYVLRAAYPTSPNYDTWFSAVVEPPAAESNNTQTGEQTGEQTGNQTETPTTGQGG